MTKPSTFEQLQQLNDRLHEELAEDARRYLELFERWKQAQGEEKEDLRAELDVQVTVLHSHSMHLEESLEEELDQTPEDEN